MSHSHFISRCSLCRKVIAQCRCLSKDKKEIHSICQACKGGNMNEKGKGCNVNKER